MQFISPSNLGNLTYSSYISNMSQIYPSSLTYSLYISNMSIKPNLLFVYFKQISNIFQISKYIQPSQLTLCIFQIYPKLISTQHRVSLKKGSFVVFTPLRTCDPFQGSTVLPDVTCWQHPDYHHSLFRLPPFQRQRSLSVDCSHHLYFARLCSFGLGFAYCNCTSSHKDNL